MENKKLLYGAAIVLIILGIAWFQFKGSESWTEIFWDVSNVEKILDTPTEIVETEDGVPYVDYGWQLGRYIGRQRYSVTVATYAFYHRRDYELTGSSKSLRKFFNTLAWLYENRHNEGNFTVWKNNFEYPFYECSPSWVSAMAQGLALKEFIHAYKLTRDARYLEIMERMVNAYHVPIEEGGLLYVDPNDNWWFEEYACKRKPRVLNGFVYALDGLYEYYLFSNSSKAKHAYERGIETLERHLHEYDSGNWTYYDLEKYPASRVYHELHVQQMALLYNQTGREAFLEHHLKWKEYIKE